LAVIQLAMKIAASLRCNVEDIPERIESIIVAILLVTLGAAAEA
jgi:hypothetical protein